MDWKVLRDGMKSDADMPARYNRLTQLALVRDGKQYDHLAYPFHQERTEGAGEYIPLRKRRPSSPHNLCRTVVDDVAALVCNEAHFPALHSPDETTREALTDLVKFSRLSEKMTDAIVKGCIGSVAIQVRILNKKVFLTAHDTACLTPKYDEKHDPDRLLSVTELKKITGADLMAAGYKGLDTWKTYWFQRIWTDSADEWYLPWEYGLTEQDMQRQGLPRLDRDNTVVHGMGVVPIVWVKNLPGGPGGVDGACTFEMAVQSSITLDYIFSQAGRALIIGGDPILFLTQPASVGVDEDGMPVAPAHQGGVTDMLSLPEGSDARFLEVSGDSARAMLEHCNALRLVVLESIHGNRAHSEKMAAAQSGKALEILNQGLVWIADHLRVSYGEGGLLSVLKMVCDASSKMPDGIEINGKAYKDLQGADLSLVWPDYYPPTPREQQELVNGAVAATGAGLMSKELAVTNLAPVFDCTDVTQELKNIVADEAAADARALAQTAAIQATETVES